MPDSPAKYLLREDPDRRFQNLFLIGPYNYGADQLYVNGYTFTGKPPDYLSSSVSALYDMIAAAASVLGLKEPTIYFVSHQRFPRRVAAFIGESSSNPMIVLFPNRLIKEPFPDTEHPISFLLKILVHELMHAHVELILGDGFDFDEQLILQWEDKFGKAQGQEKGKVLHDFVAEVAKHG